MSYCTVDDIASDFKDITFSTTSSVTENEVTAFIKQECEYIDGMINDRYITPVEELASPKAWEVLKRINIFLASDRVRHVLAVKTGQDSLDSDAKGQRSFSRRPNKDLENIRNNKLDLIDAVERTSEIGFDVGSPKSCCDMLFNPSKQQW